MRLNTTTATTSRGGGTTSTAARMRCVCVAMASLSLEGCASGKEATAGFAAGVTDTVPHWLGGLPPDAPPRRGTPEYEAWHAQRAQEAARPKNADKPK